MDNQPIQQKLITELVGQYSKDEIRAFLFWILPHIQNTQTDREAELNRIILELKTGKPIQYIFEIAFFMQTSKCFSKIAALAEAVAA